MRNGRKVADRRSLPDMPDASGLYLQMSPGGSYADTTSPAFNVNLAAGRSAETGLDIIKAHRSCERRFGHRVNRHRHRRAYVARFIRR
jgi:hypothetical protein